MLSYKKQAMGILMSRPALAVTLTVLVAEAVVLLLGGLYGGTWEGLWWMAFLGVFWAASMALGGSTAPRNRLGLMTVAGLAFFLAADQIGWWITACGG